jgi:hypothetical protein
MQPSRFLIVRSEAGMALQITTDLVELCPNVGDMVERIFEMLGLEFSASGFISF